MKSFVKLAVDIWTKVQPHFDFLICNFYEKATFPSLFFRYTRYFVLVATSQQSASGTPAPKKRSKPRKKTEGGDEDAKNRPRQRTSKAKVIFPTLFISH